MKLNVKNSTWIEQQFSVVNLFHYWEYSVEILKKKKNGQFSNGGKLFCLFIEFISVISLLNFARRKSIKRALVLNNLPLTTR